MKAILASVVAAVLLGLLGLCPLPMCAMATVHACCHKTQTQSHCPVPSVQDCPYFILEKGKTAPKIAWTMPVFSTSVASQPLTINSCSRIRTEVRLPDYEDLYLRVRVLLI